MSSADAAWLHMDRPTNLMVVTAMVPNKGIPLPFLSFGGSSLCFTLASIGILMNISNRNQTSEIGPQKEKPE